MARGEAPHCPPAEQRLGLASPHEHEDVQHQEAKACRQPGKTIDATESEKGADWRAAGRDAAWQRTVKRLNNAKQLATPGETMQLGGGSLVLGPGLPQDVRRLALLPGGAGSAAGPEPPMVTMGGELPLWASPVGNPGASNGADRKSARRLLRFADPQAKVAFLGDHPFFRDTSAALRERLAPQLVQRSSERTTEMIEQGAKPAGSMDYLFITAPDVHTRVEVLFDGRPIALLTGSAVFGHEVVFGVARSFLFGVRLAAGSSSALWVIPRPVIESVLQREAHKGDAKVLRERAHTSSAALIRSWYSRPMVQIRLRLFENAEHTFKAALLQAASIEVHAPGAVLRRDSCFCVFRGEASVNIPGRSECVARLSHAQGTNAWAAWWGLLEVLGVCPHSPTEVRAETDCIVWYLAADALRGLRKHFPNECRLLDKVAAEHAKLLQPCAPPMAAAPLFHGCSPETLQKLDAAIEAQVFTAGAAVLREGAPNTHLFFLARGRCCLRRQGEDQATPGQHTRRRRASSAESRGVGGSIVCHIGEGSFFGESTALGFATACTATVHCETICDVRLMPGDKLVELVAADPQMVTRLLELVRSTGTTTHCDAPARPAEDLAQLRAHGLSGEAVRRLDQEAGRLLTFRRQLIAERGSRSKTLYVLVEGTVLLETEEEGPVEVPGPALLGEEALLEPQARHPMGLRSKSICCFRTIEAERIGAALEKLPKDLERLLQCARESRGDGKGGPSTRSLNKSRVSQRNSFGSVSQAPPHSSPGGSALGTPRHSESHEPPEAAEDTENGYFVNGKPTSAFLLRFFKDSEEAFLQFLLSGMQHAVYFEGQVMLQEGDEGDFAILIHRGSGKVEIGGVKVGEVQAGSLIGEAVLFGQNARRTATVRAEGMVSAYTLSRNVLMEAFEGFPAEKRHIEQLARLRGITNQVLTAPRSQDKSQVKRFSLQLPKDLSQGAMSGKRMSRFIDANALIFGSVSRWSKDKGRNLSWVQQRGAAMNGPTRRATRAGPGPPSLAARSPSPGSSSSGSGSDESGRKDPKVQWPSGSSLGMLALQEESDEDRNTPGRADSFASSIGWRPPTVRQLNPPELVPDEPIPEAARRCREWAGRRHAQIRDAETKRHQRLARRGELLPLVPGSQGYVVPEATPGRGAPFAPAECGRDARPCWQRLRRVQDLYARPVWHEVFGY